LSIGIEHWYRALVLSIGIEHVYTYAHSGPK